MSFRRRPYPEILDSLLTSLLGGTASETHPCPDTGVALRIRLLENSVERIYSVWGALNGATYLFKKDADYKILENNTVIEWTPKGRSPDKGSLVYVNYRSTSASSPVSDVHTGSVVRTLAESVGLEIAQLYANMEMVYRAGFIDTAEGSSLDKVVALLGIERVRGGRPAGKIRFSRVPGTSGLISIPRGTRLGDEKGNVQYETTEAAEMEEQQNALLVPVRDLEVNDPVPADTLIVLPRPIAGISSVTNPAPTLIQTIDESDDELRNRARAFLHGSERATLGAIEAAITAQGVRAELEENSDGPGTIGITLLGESLDPEVLERVYKAVDDARPASVLPKYKGIKTPLKVDVDLVVATDPSLQKTDIRAAHQNIIEALKGYFAALPVKADASLSKLASLALQVRGVTDVSISSAGVVKNGAHLGVIDREKGVLALSGDPTVLGDVKIADPNMPSLVTVIITHAAGAALPDKKAVSDAMATLLAARNQANGSAAAETSLAFEDVRNAIVLPGGSAGAANYSIQCVITQAGGLSIILKAVSDPAYVPLAGERFALDAVTIGQGSRP